jgi:hypothetical protein
MPAPRLLHWLCGAFLAGASTSTLPAGDDTYLELLDREVTKVEPVSTDKPRDRAATPPQDDSNRPAQPAPSREQFEALLRRHHVGTYSFYRRLPARSREEIFLDYSDGTSTEALREKVIERYLHP